MIAALAALATKYFTYFPGDVAVERWVQSLVSPNLSWAEGVSRTAEFPWILLIMAFILALSWALAGWRAALLSILSLVGVLAVGALLGPVIARPRPSPDLCGCFGPFQASVSLPCLP